MIMRMSVSREDCERRAKIFAALSDATRLWMVEMLRQHNEMSGSAAAEALGISLALLCHHAKVLTDVGLVLKRKEGQTVYYSLDEEVLAACIRSLL